MSGRTSQDAAQMIGGNVFELALIVTIRVRELKAGATPKVLTTAGPSVTAMLEVEQGMIGRDYLEKVPGYGTGRRR